MTKKQQVHADPTSQHINSAPTNKTQDVTAADEEDHDDKHIAGLEHLSSMKHATAHKMKILDHYAYYKQAKEDNANWFRTITHLKRNIHVDDHVYGLGLREVRQNVIELMENPMSEVFILILVLTDMVMVIIEIVIDRVFDFDFNSGEGSRILAGIGKDAACNIERAYDIASSCRIVSITILCVFALELVVKFLCAPKGFCKHFGHMLDVIVVGGSLLFEFTLHHSAGALLIFFRCWRGVRILHGLYEQIEYISKALETEAHLEHALGTVNKFKAFTKTNVHLRQQWKIFKRREGSDSGISEDDIEESALRSTASPNILGNDVTVEEIEHPMLT
eukprot:gnl/MRDRNA2_/MRDRNA2_34552_c0_seq1.p1 gnl/MRDRNA2_/MRDRNA2_34552_c0~~gnl/MRDRNA2_/MRDRNA2_34552_c0_seq1.p1  ORF type:complete len:334 (+),score=60.74 gnl/MRDRNA2_/MRDRNA2_34552_c0_seq1:218-1219(+)